MGMKLGTVVLGGVGVLVGAAVSSVGDGEGRVSEKVTVA